MSGEALTWAMIGIIVGFSTGGDVLTARAMKEIGDLDDLRHSSGLLGASRAVLLNPKFILGVLCLASAFYSLLTAVSFADVSLVAPAAAALTFLSNAIVAKFYLKENVNARRWTSAVLICGGVYLLR